MPTSQYGQLNEIVEMISLTDPQKVLDIGVGFGKYGFLAREYLEFYDGREQYRDWKRRIEGIEAFPDYITDVHRQIYDEIHLGNALEILPKLPADYDLILLIDVLEHFSQADGIKLLELCLARSRNVLISTPQRVGPQEGEFGNPYETHRFEWKAEHYANLGQSRFFVPNETSLICYLGQDAERVRRDSPIVNARRIRLKRRLPWLVAPARAAKRLLRG